VFDLISCYVPNILFVPCPLPAQREGSQRPKTCRGIRESHPLLCGTAVSYFMSTPMALAYATFYELLLHVSPAPAISVASDSGGGATARRGPFVRIAFSLCIPAAARSFPVRVLTKCGGRRRTRPLATTCLPKAKKNTAIGNNLFTEVLSLFSRRCAHRKIWVCSYNGDASLLMLTTTTHQLTILFISACTVFLHCDTLGSVVDAKRM
jgi:hypothetical protein